MGMVIIGSSCSTMKSSSSTAPVSAQQVEKKSSSPEFIQTISIKGKQSIDAPPLVKSAGTVNTGQVDKSTIELASPVLLKYAILMNAPVEELNNDKLINFIDEWYGTKYRLGGEDKNGVDCSAFVQSFMESLYEIQVPRTSKEQYAQSQRIRKTQLNEGDLVFFHTKGKGKTVSHVGVYLRNNKFIHASSSGGVMISDLDEDYFMKRYVGSGRCK
jgi:hypothetical protein